MKLLKEFALKSATNTINKACPWVLYTPKMPKGAEKLKKNM